MWSFYHYCFLAVIIMNERQAGGQMTMTEGERDRMEESKESMVSINGFKQMEGAQKRIRM